MAISQGGSQSLSGPGLRHHHRGVQVEARELITRPTLITMPEALGRTAREKLYLGHFWSAMLPQSQLFSPKAAALTSVGWTGAIPQFYDADAALKHIVLACAMASLAAENGDTQLRAKALQSYNAAVRTVALILKTKDAFMLDGLIITIRLMALFEVCALSIIYFGKEYQFVDASIYPRSCLFQIRIQESLYGEDTVQANKLSLLPAALMHSFLARLTSYLWIPVSTWSVAPTSFISQTNDGLHYLCTCKLTCLTPEQAILAMGQRHASPFNSQEWKTIPWSTQSPTSMDKLMDIMLEIPELLEQLDNFLQIRESAGDRPRNLQAQISIRCQALETALSLWAKEMGTPVFRFDFSLQGLPLAEPKDDAEFALLHLCIVYWFNQMVVCSVASYIAQPDETTPPQKLEERAFKCCHAIPLLLQASGGFVQDVTGLLVLSIALRYFVTIEPGCRTSPESQLLEALLERPMAGTPIRHLMTRLYHGRDPLLARRKSEDIAPVDVVAWF